MPSVMFSDTFSASNSEKCWNTMATPAVRAALGSAGWYGWPLSVMLPLSGRTRP